MATIPTFPTFAAGEVLTDGKLNDFVTAASFYGNSPKAQIKRTAAQTIAALGTTIQFQVVDFDTDNMADLVADNDALTIVTPGYYFVSGMIDWREPGSPTSYRIVEIRKNGTIFGANTGPILANADFALSVSAVIPLSAGDKLSLYFLHNFSPNMSTGSTYGGCRLYAEWKQEL